jgi:carboxymethylenebutenolidase
MGERCQLRAADGFTLGAYRALPAGRPRGGVVVIQEIFGVNPHIRAVTDGYASAGYAAIAPQIFDRAERDVELGYEPADMTRGVGIARGRLKMEQTLLDLQAAVDDAARFGKVGVVGYCFGGLLTWLAACDLKGVAAASSYYGGGVASQLARSAQCPVMMHFGERDAHIPLTDVEKVRKAHPEIQVHVYAADHGFNCDHRASFDAAAAKLALERTLAFFKEHVG